MALDVTKSSKAKKKKVDHSQKYGPGITMTSFLMASSNGEISEEEYEVLAQLLSGMVEGATYEQLNELLEGQAAMLEENGWDACVASLGEMLDNDEVKKLALELAAAVALSDGDFSEDQEGEAFLGIADGMGFDREAAKQIFEQVAEDLSA